MPLHLILAHVPVVLVLVGAAADLVGALGAGPVWRRSAGTFLVLGGVAALLAFLTGQGAVPHALARTAAADAASIDVHATLGAAGVWVLGGAAALRLAWRDRLRGTHGALLLAAALASALVVLAVARTGLAIANGG